MPAPVASQASLASLASLEVKVPVKASEAAVVAPQDWFSGVSTAESVPCGVDWNSQLPQDRVEHMVQEYRPRSPGDQEINNGKAVTDAVT